MHLANIGRRSTEVARYKLIGKMEITFGSKNITLYSFLDIYGAFNYTIVRHVDAMFKHRNLLLP